MAKLDLNQLITEIRRLERHQRLYKILKVELSKLGFWKNRPRGNPNKGYEIMKGKGK